MKKTIAPKVVSGGKAVPLGNNYYYMSGRKHKDGGIAIGHNPKTGLEVEGGEVMHLTPDETKVFSSVPILNGKSPAQRLMGGENPTKVFNAQEKFKEVNNLNDDGTSKKKAIGGKIMNRKKAATGTRVPNDPFGTDEVVTPFGVYGPINNDTQPFAGIDFNNAIAGSSSVDMVNQNTGSGASSTGNSSRADSNWLSNIGGMFNRGAKAVGQYAKENPWAIGDASSLISNTVGGLIGAASNRRMLNSLKYSNAPVGRKAVKLKTQININPQLDKMRESLAAYERDIDSNTGSSRVALARKQRARLANVSQVNELYGTKENMETELINRDKLNQQEIDNANVADYNRWAENKANFDNAVREKRSENAIGLIDALNSGVQDIISRGERRAATKQNALIMAAGNPNVNPRILRDMGVKGITDKDIANWDKAYGKKKANK